MKRNLTLLALTILTLGVMFQVEARTARRAKPVVSPKHYKASNPQDMKTRATPLAIASEEARLIDLENTLLTAVRNQDANAVRSLIAPDAQMSNARATAKSADFFLTSLDSKQLVVNDVIIDNMKVDFVSNDVAIVTYYAKIDGSYFGLPFGDGWHYASSCWVRSRSQWRVVYHQDTDLKYEHVIVGNR